MFCQQTTPIVTDGVVWSIGHSRQPRKNSWTDRDAIWFVDLGGPKGPRNHILNEIHIPMQSGNFEGGKGGLL